MNLKDSIVSIIFINYLNCYQKNILISYSKRRAYIPLDIVDKVIHSTECINFEKFKWRKQNESKDFILSSNYYFYSNTFFRINNCNKLYKYDIIEDENCVNLFHLVEYESYNYLWIINSSKFVKQFEIFEDDEGYKTYTYCNLTYFVKMKNIDNKHTYNIILNKYKFTNNHYYNSILKWNM